MVITLAAIWWVCAPYTKHRSLTSAHVTVAKQRGSASEHLQKSTTVEKGSTPKYAAEITSYNLIVITRYKNIFDIYLTYYLFQIVFKDI